MAQPANSYGHRLTAQTLLAFLLVISGMAMVMIALFLPPVGEIHPSVITVFGMVLVAAGAFLGIDLNLKLHSLIDHIKEKNTHKSQSDETA